MNHIVITIFLLTLSSTSLAHSGHEHSHPMATLIHLLWLAPLLVGAAALFIKLNKRSIDSHIDK